MSTKITGAASRLAQAILDFDEDNHGDPEAAIEVPADVWAEWIDLAGQIDNESDEVT